MLFNTLDVKIRQSVLKFNTYLEWSSIITSVFEVYCIQTFPFLNRNVCKRVASQEVNIKSVKHSGDEVINESWNKTHSCAYALNYTKDLLSRGGGALPW